MTSRKKYTTPPTILGQHAFRENVELEPLSSKMLGSVNSSSQQNTIYGLIFLRETGKQSALIAETFSSQNNIEKFRCAV